MDYSEVDWSRCNLPTCGMLHKIEVAAFGGVRVLLGKTVVAYLGTNTGWEFGSWEAPHPRGLSREEAEWALKAADAVDAFLREEQERTELESQPWMTPSELLIYLAKNKGPIRVQSSNYSSREIEFEFGATSLTHRFPASPVGVLTETSLSWFLTSNGNYRIIPQSQPDTPSVEKQTKKVWSAEGDLVEWEAHLNGIRFEFSNLTVASPGILPMGQVRLTLEVEEDAPRFETGADVGFTLRIEGP